MADRNPIHAAGVPAAMRSARALPLVSIVAALLVAGCSLLPVPQPSALARPAGPVPGTLEEQLAAWRATGPASYTWQVEFSCECGLSGRKEITVVDGKVTKVQSPTGEIPLSDLADAPLTVDAILVKGLEATKNGGGVTGSWSGTNGLPSELSIDPVPNAIDDELSLRVVRLDPAP